MILLFGKVVKINTIFGISVVVVSVLFAILALRVYRRSSMYYDRLKMTKYRDILDLVDSDLSSLEIQNLKDKKTKKQVESFRKFIIFGYDETLKEDINSKLKVLDRKNSDDLPITFDDVYVQSCIYMFVYLIVVIVLGFIHPLIWIAIVFYKAIGTIPYAIINSAYSEVIVNIEKQMPKFISMFYYRYSKEESVYDLIPLLDDYMPLASKELLRLLTLLKNSIKEVGDTEALKHINELYKESYYVREFTNTAMALAQYKLNAKTQLSNLYSELKTIRLARFKAEKIKRSERREFLIGSLVLPILVATFVIILSMMT